MHQLNDHQQRIQEEFTLQADTFAQVTAHSAELPMNLLLSLAQLQGSEHVLDVACGPGLVSCAFAPHAAHVRGQDIVPRMIARAEERALELKLNNVSWDVADCLALPYADGSFDVVVTRYSFHHFERPAQALREMKRVCKPGGRLLVADVCPAPAAVAAYDRFETIRDPSHTHALTEAEFEATFAAEGVHIIKRARYGLPIELEAQLTASFPEPGGAERLRKLFAADIGVNELGVDARREGSDIYFTYPVLVLVATRSTPKTEQ